MFKVQAHAARTISWWYKQKNKIDFEPPYQRKGNLWGDKDKAYLIDSILNEYDIPKIYLADFTILNSSLNRNSLPYAVIDGRQRLESIFAFYEDRIPLNKDFVYYGGTRLALGGYTYSRLSSEYPEVASIFEEFNLDVMSVITDEEEKIKDLFVRLNRSKALTGAELRNAMEGVVPDLIRGLSDRVFFKTKVKFTTSRGQDANVAAKLLLIELNGKFVDTKKKQLDQMVKEGATTEDPDKFYDAALRATKVLDKMEQVFRESDPLLTTHGLIPLYYDLCKLHYDPALIRGFLEDFQKRRRINQSIAKENPANADSHLLSFDAAVRSINDSGSLIAAANILKNAIDVHYTKSIAMP